MLGVLPVDWEPTTAIIGKAISKFTSDLRIISWISEIKGISFSMTQLQLKMYNFFRCFKQHTRYNSDELFLSIILSPSRSFFKGFVVDVAGVEVLL